MSEANDDSSESDFDQDLAAASDDEDDDDFVPRSTAPKARRPRTVAADDSSGSESGVKVKKSKTSAIRQRKRASLTSR